MIAAHEAFAAGRPTGARKLPRFILARRMKVDRRKIADIDFTGSDLDGSSFIETDLSRALFCGAVLSRCDFTRAILSRADLRGAAIAGARLNWARLDGADLRSAVLVHKDDLLSSAQDDQTSARGSRLDAARLDEIQAQSVDFANSSMRGAVFRNANLKGAKFANCDLDGAEFAGARITGADFSGAILTNVDVGALGLSRETLATCLVNPDVEAVARADALRARLAEGEAWARSGGREGRPADVSRADLRPLGDAFRGRPLPALIASEACGVGLDFSKALLVGANFEKADLRGARFEGADLRGASFRGANLAHATLRGADLGPLALASGGSRKVDFDGAVLDGAEVAQVMMI